MHENVYVFLVSSRRRHTIFDCDWSSDVCSSDLHGIGVREEDPGRTDVHRSIRRGLFRVRGRAGGRRRKEEEQGGAEEQRKSFEHGADRLRWRAPIPPDRQDPREPLTHTIIAYGRRLKEGVPGSRGGTRYGRNSRSALPFQDRYFAASRWEAP